MPSVSDGGANTGFAGFTESWAKAKRSGVSKAAPAAVLNR
jgi:hypothetical protein